MQVYSVKSILLSKKAVLISCLICLITLIILFLIPDKPIGTKDEVFKSILALWVMGIAHVCSVIYIMLVATISIIKKGKYVFYELLPLLFAVLIWLYIIISSIYSNLQRFSF